MSVPLNEKLSTLAELASKPKLLSALLSFYHSGYLKSTGWLRSFETLSPQDEKGNPLPWMTLPFIDFLESRDISSFSIFEYGSGNSTLYFGPRVKSVTSSEHSKEWLEKIQPRAAKNCTLLYTPLGDKYAGSAAGTGSKYDMIIVDAEERVECVYQSVSALSEGGVLILDDSEREEYAPAFSFMKENGFKKIDFTGMAPGVLFKKCTTVFYKQENLLRI